MYFNISEYSLHLCYIVLNPGALRYKLVLDSDAEQFGGHQRVQAACQYAVDEMEFNERPYSLQVSFKIIFTFFLISSLSYEWFLSYYILSFLGLYSMSYCSCTCASQVMIIQKTFLYGFFWILVKVGNIIVDQSKIPLLISRRFILIFFSHGSG